MKYLFYGVVILLFIIALTNKRLNWVKTVTGYIGSYITYWIGDILCRINFDWAAAGYQLFMHWSGEIQDWAGNKKPWSKPNNNE